MAESVGQLIVVPSAGLCNRLQTIVCAQLLAEDTGRRLLVNWHPEWGCAVDYEDLFATPFPALHDLPADTVCYTSIRPKSRAQPGPYFDLLNGAPEERFTKLKRDRSRVLAVITCHQFLSYFHDPRFGPGLRRLLQDVRPEISRQVERFMAAHFGQPTVGVHVRRGDWGEQRDLDFYVNRMLRFRDATFYVSTDDPEVFERIQRRCPRSVRFSASTEGRTSRDGMLLAMIDLLLLSNTSYLIGTPGSSFSAVARVCGDMPGNFDYGLSISMPTLKLGNLSNLGAKLLRRALRAIRG